MTGTVVRVAGDKTDKESPRCKKFVDAGAVCIKWPADIEFNEEESYIWSILTDNNWNKEAVMGWRYTKAQWAKLCDEHAPANRRVRSAEQRR